jgi:hypothetical protein
MMHSIGDARLVVGAIFLILGAGAWFAVSDHPQWSNGSKYFMMFVALIFILTGLAMAFAWLGSVNHKERLAILRERTDTEAVKIAQAVKFMTPAQLDALSQFVPAYEIISGTIQGEPSNLVGWKRTPFGVVDLAFMSEFADLCGDEYTAPIRTWAEESNQGAWARRIRDTLIHYGYIEKQSFGNKSYRFIDRDRAMQYLRGA